MVTYNTRTLPLTIAYLILWINLSFHLIIVSAAPSVTQKHTLDTKVEFEQALDNFLNAYYDELFENGPDEVDETETKLEKSGKAVEDIYEQMQGDQPVDYNEGTRHSNDDVVKTRDRFKRRTEERLRKENWVEYLKSQILTQLGRSNTTTFTKPPEEPTLTDFNITQIIPKIFNSTSLDDDQITEKIRSFYPSCETPLNQEQDQWKDSDDVMTLYFDFDYNSDNKNNNIASATLRLYRLPQNNTNHKLDNPKDNCKTFDSTDEEKLLRVSVYWYTKFQKKRRVKRRLSDSKVVPETARWVELSVKPATKAWNKAGTRNLGLGILVEDQEGKALRTDKYFKGASCTVGVSTPKPIPTIVRDTSHTQADELDRIHNLPGRNSTTTVYSDLLLLPTVDICYLEFPENTDVSRFNSARINACNLRKIHEENQRLAERERLERLATLQFPSARHIRHQRQHRQNKLNPSDLASLKLEDISKQKPGKPLSEFESSLRSSISNKQIVFTREELEELQRDSER